METVVEPEAKPTQEEVGRWADGEIARLMGVINAATAELVGVVATAIEAEAWGGWGLRSPAHWLGWRAGLSPARATGLVQVARRSSELPQVFGLFGQGALSEDALRVIAARTPPERDGEVAGLAQVLTVPQLTRVLGSLPKAEPAKPRPRTSPPPPPPPPPSPRSGWGSASTTTAPSGSGWWAWPPSRGRAASGRYQVVVHLRPGPDGPHADLHLGCGPHHRAHHQGTLGISGDPTRPDGLVFTDRWGDPSSNDRHPPRHPAHCPTPSPSSRPRASRSTGATFSWN